MRNEESIRAVMQWLEDNRSDFIAMADEIWAKPELAFEEYTASRLQADYLQGEGFSIRWNIGGLETAFIAEWGEGKPILGFIGEYDALPGLSQKAQTTKEPVEEGAPGHGCGHNLLGTGAVAGAVAVQKWLESSEVQGTVRYYGCPAEEKGSGKVYMARAGSFDDLDAALNFHPSTVNHPSKGKNVGVVAIFYRFFGRTAHAGGSPHEGRSALDAVELMNVGVNYLREHVKDDVRMHYIITEGGKAPNIVPEEAEVYYFLRANKTDDLAELIDRVKKIAQGAAMMTETSLEIRFEDGCSAILNNHYLADLQYKAMEMVGPIHYTEEEVAFAQGINDSFPGTNSDYIDRLIDHFEPSAAFKTIFEEYRQNPLVGINFPAIDERVMMTGSTDVGDLSRITPVSMLRTTCSPTGVPGHSWGNVASSGMSVGHKGMMHAAKIMAATAVEIYTDPEHLEQIRREFQESTKGVEYIPPIPDDSAPIKYDPEGSRD